MARPLLDSTSKIAEASSERFVFRSSTAQVPHTLVAIFLRGGMDGFTTVPVWGDKHLAIGRAGLALPEPSARSGMIDLDGFYGLHATMKPLEDLYRSGDLAIIHGVGSPNETMSHFEAMKTVERGAADAESLATGWLGRHLAESSSDNHSPLRSIAVSKLVPNAMIGGPSLALPDLMDFRLDIPTNWSPRFAAILENLYRRQNSRLADSGKDIFQLLGQMRALQRQGESQGSYPDTPLGKNLAQVGKLIKADLGLEVASLEMKDWDTHINQERTLVPLMSSLAGSIRALCDDLGPRLRTTTILVYSEFGRRVKPNVTTGTDHGRASAMFVLGGGIRGGKVYGTWAGAQPDLLDHYGCVRVTTDYRHVLAEIAAQRMGNRHLDRLFPNFQPQPLGLVAAPVESDA